MSKTIALAILAMVASPVFAQSICRTFEYAELRDMRREKLEQLYCDYRSDMYSMLDVALIEMKAGHTISSQRAQADSSRCAGELERIERLLDSKFGAKAPQCPKK